MTADVNVTVEYANLTRNEVGQAIGQLPAGTPATITRVPTSLGGKRFRLRVPALSAEDARDLTSGVLGYMAAVQKGQAHG